MANTLNLGNGNWATKEDSLLAYNSENGNYKPLPFDFTRASSATVVNKAGLIETVGSGEPRIDYKDDSKGALKLEPIRTNLITYSEDFENYFNVTEITLNSNYAISPDGTLNANKVTFPSTSNSMYKSGLSLSGMHTISFYVKGEGANIGKTFDVDINGTSVSQNIDVTLTNEWVRFEAQTDGLTILQITNRSSTTIGTGSLILFGFQVEQGSYATSYIPNFGNSAGATRSADSSSQTVPDGIIGQTEGTMYVEIDFKSKPEAGSPIIGLVALNNNVNNLQNCIILGIERQSGGVNRFYPYVQVGNSTVAYVIGGTLTDGNYKVAFAYKQNDFILYVNGVQIGTDTNGAVPTTSQFLVGERYNSDPFKIADGIKETKLYNTRLSNAELQALTTI